jgi:hypothetical protein
MELLISSHPRAQKPESAFDHPQSETEFLSLLWEEAERGLSAEQTRRESEQAWRALAVRSAQPISAPASVRFAYD